MLFDKGGLDDAPAVCCADDPEGDGAAGKDEDPAVAAIGGALVAVEGCLDHVVGVGGGGGDVVELYSYGLG